MSRKFCVTYFFKELTVHLLSNRNPGFSAPKPIPYSLGQDESLTRLLTGWWLT